LKAKKKHFFMGDAGAGRWNQTTKQRAGSPVSSK